MKRLYVGNLPWSVGESELRAIFSGYGVKEASVVMDRDTGRSRGFGFVDIGSDSEAERAITEVNGSTHEGRSLVVNEARERERRPQDGRDRGRRG